MSTKKTGILMLVLCIVFGIPADVNALTTHLPDGFLISDENGINASRDGSYFIHVDDIKAGDTIIKVLTINNVEPNGLFRLTLTAVPGLSSGPVNLLDRIHLKLTLNGNSIYDGRLYGDDGNNMIENGVSLGEYAEGHSAQLVMTFMVADDIGSELLSQKSIAEIDWMFSAVKNEPGDPVKTGDTGQTALVSLCAAMLCAICLMLVIGRGMEKNRAPGSVDITPDPVGIPPDFTVSDISLNHLREEGTRRFLCDHCKAY